MQCGDWWPDVQLLSKTNNVSSEYGVKGWWSNGPCGVRHPGLNNANVKFWWSDAK